MIREYIKEDINQIRKLLSLECDNNKCEEIIQEMESSNQIFVYNNGQIQGFIFTTLYDKNSNGWSVTLYVQSNLSIENIGSSLYKVLVDYLKEKNPNGLRTVLDSKNTKLINFFEKRNFKKWYGTYGLEYDGPKFNDIDINFIPFDMKYYTKYAKTIDTCFYSIEKDNNIEPTHNLHKDQGYYDYVVSIKDTIYILLDSNDEIITSFRIEEDNIDHIIVALKYQGQHFGKKATQYAINKLKDQGVKQIFLSCLEKNPKALNLYLSLGFKIIEKTVTYINKNGIITY